MKTHEDIYEEARETGRQGAAVNPYGDSPKAIAWYDGYRDGLEEEGHRDGAYFRDHADEEDLQNYW